MREGISQSVQSSSCGHKYMRQKLVPVCRAGFAGGVSFEFVFF